MRLGLLIKLAVPAITIAVIGLGVSASISYNKTSKAIQSSVNAQQVQAADTTARNARLWMDNRILEVKGWADTDIYHKSLEDSFLGKTARKAAGKRLERDKANYPMYQTLLVATSSGEVVASSDAGMGKTEEKYLNGKAFEAAKQGKFSAKHAVPTADDKPVSVLYTPINNKGSTAGVLIAVIDLSSFGNNFVTPLKSGETGQVEVYGQDGVVFLNARAEQEFTKDLKQSGIFQEISQEGRGVVNFEEDGTTRVAAYSTVEGLPWSVLVSANEDEVLASAREARFISFLALLIVAVVIAAGVYLVVRATLNPIKDAVENLKDLSSGNGDLTKRLQVKSQDEVADLGRYFNQFVEKLLTVVLRVRNSTDQVAMASESLAAITVQTDASLNRQRSEIEMIASSVNEMSTTAQSVASNAAEAASFTEHAGEQAVSGKLTVEATISAIDDLATGVENSSQVILALRDESQSIGAVLDVIKGIAEQTNLLALNAAIEAARAGEMGRGFAVVADEVRTLAQRTQTSTYEIEQMIGSLQGKAEKASDSIENSHNKAQDTVMKAREAGKVLQSINEAVQHITEMNHQIASAAEEQLAVTNEITQNVSNLHGVTEETAAASQKTAESSQELNQSSAELKDVVSQFSV